MEMDSVQAAGGAREELESERMMEEKRTCG
jgi:hypothetical protein